MMEHLASLKEYLAFNPDVLYVSLGLGALSLFLHFTSKVNLVAPDEPPLLPGALPIVGHAVGYIRDLNAIYERARDWSPASHPVSLSLFGKRIYVIVNPKDASSVWRAKTLSFELVVEWGMAKMFGMTKDGREKMHTDPDGSGDMYHNQHTHWRDALSPGDALNSLTTRFIEWLEKDLDNISYALRPATSAATPKPSNSLTDVSMNTLGLKLQDGEIEVSLRTWVVDHMGFATTNAAIGPQLLENQPNLIQLFLTWETEIIKLVMGFPEFMAPRGYKSRREIIKAFEKWGILEEDMMEPLKKRSEMVIARNASLWDQATCNFSLWSATQSNAGPSAFWILYEILRHPKQRAIVEKEIEGAFTKDENGVDRLTDLNHLLNNAPMLASFWWEVLRYTAGSVSTREVAEDTRINNYTFKAGSIVMIPLRTGHYDPRVFGEDVHEFKPERFLPDIMKNRRSKEDTINAEKNKEQEIENAKIEKGLASASGGPSYASASGQEKHPSVKSLRPFGGGVSLCPGRHFAANEVYAFVACALRRFDFELLEPNGEAKPAVKLPVVAAYPPDREVIVRIRLRQ